MDTEGEEVRDRGAIKDEIERGSRKGEKRNNIRVSF